MPLAGDFAALCELQRRLDSLSRRGGAGQRLVAQRIGEAGKERIRAQMASGTAPDGSPQVPRKDGKPGLVSSKIPAGVRFYPVANGVRWVVNPRWIAAHNYGHVFPSRTEARVTDSRGRLLSEKRLAKIALKAEAHADAGGITFARTGKRSSRLVARATYRRIGQRVLPRRPVYPGRLEDAKPWEQDVGSAAGEAIGELLTRIG